MRIKRKTCFITTVGGVLAIISFYLMRFIDEITLTTNMQRFFVWLYFEVLLFGIFYVIHQKIVYKARYYTFTLLGCILISIIIGIMTQNKYLPRIYMENDIKVFVSEKKNSNSQGQEVWLKKIELDGEVWPLDLYANAEAGWNMSGDILVGNYGKSKKLSLLLPKAKKIQIKFGMQNRLGIVSIDENNTLNNYDLYSDIDKDRVVTISGISVPYTGLQYLILFIGYVLGLFSVLFVIMSSILKKSIYERGL